MKVYKIEHFASKDYNIDAYGVKSFVAPCIINAHRNNQTIHITLYNVCI